MFRKFGPAIGLVLTLALVATACGDDDGSASTVATTAATGTTAAAMTGVPECLDTADLYALLGEESIGFDNWSDANALAAEIGAPNAPYPDMPLDITAPGEESGTFDTFVEFLIDGVAGGEDYADTREASNVRPDYVASANDNVIIEGISNAPAGLGWVGYSFFVNNADKVRALEVSAGGGPCVAPTPETIADGSYPFSRPLFIYVSKAAAARPEVAAFVDFYLSDAGIASVAEQGYVALADYGDVLAAWLAGRPEVDTSGDLGGSVTISGSSTVEPISGANAEKFAATNPGVAISVEGPGTGDGFALFCQGQTDISDASRAIKDSERETCAANGVEFVELHVAIDGLSVLTNLP
ncbi:MAG: substrate-binding domain-containing protein [Actinobacteria bacterium]|nr:substrate-binding domain-containing protein [Actinomycetota bacterium]MBU1494145.1 substrate-binding domain-containing protein [Actinomycetota bacterium]MBU1865700.1 substrate-binding domain-containing protein [Actinomycetota bacterium]